MKTSLLNDTTEDIRLAADIIRGGGLVAFPTETVYGLGADALNESAVSKVYEAKGRPSDNPMIVHIAEFEDLYKLTESVTDDMKHLMDAFWPGPMTMILRRSSIVPDVTTGGLDTVGVRLPSNEVARKLIKEAGCPLAAPSANISGRPSPTTAEHVIYDLYGRVDAIICGEGCDYGIESSVIDMTGEVPTILRPGAITREMFSEALVKDVAMDKNLYQRPEKLIDPEQNASSDYKDAEPGDSDEQDFRPKSPGMKYKHYAPEAEMIVFEGEHQSVIRAIDEEEKCLSEQGKSVYRLSFTDEQIAAHELFAKLREADSSGADVILAEALPEKGLGFSVMNRMLKSAGYNVRRIK